MKKEALIVVKDKQTSYNGTQGVEITTRGYIIYGHTDTYMICYDERLDEENTCHTTIRVNKGVSYNVVKGGA